jgi:exodeoxyribonuclease-3
MRFMEALTAFVGEYEASGRPLVLCGDMNIAPTEMDVHSKERKPGGIGQRPEERALFARMVGHGLVDVHRKMEPDNPDLFTWWAPWRNMRQRNIGWRLDFVLASRIIADGTVSCVVRREFGTSDHGPVIAVFSSLP